MRREDLYISMAKNAMVRCGVALSQEEQDDCDDLTIGNLNEFITKYKAKCQLTQLILGEIEKRKDNIDELALDVDGSQYLYIYTVEEDRKGVLREFPFCDVDYNIVPFKCFVEKTSVDEATWIALERIYDTAANNDATQEEFFQALKSTDKSKVYLNTSIQIDDTKSWNYFSYAYIRHAVFSDKGFAVPSNLEPVNLPIPVFNYINSGPYEQFLDIANALNEARQVKDILSQFLRIYHILEYFTYRKKLASIATNNISRNSFVRKVEGIKKDAEEVNLEAIIRSYFGNWETTLNYGSFSPDTQSCMKELFEGIENLGDMKSVSRWIYGVRNCIAHNKDTDCHFTITNEQDYIAIVPAMKKFIVQATEDILALLNNPTKVASLKFSSPTLRLY